MHRREVARRLLQHKRPALLLQHYVHERQPFIRLETGSSGTMNQSRRGRILQASVAEHYPRSEAARIPRESPHRIPGSRRASDQPENASLDYECFCATLQEQDGRQANSIAGPCASQKMECHFQGTTAVSSLDFVLQLHLKDRIHSHHQIKGKLEAVADGLHQKCASFLNTIFISQLIKTSQAVCIGIN